ncbi:MAG TPA: DUF4058 family protein [Fimbriiglobus sp.]|nr:DUF4058 family protein [Fimbriiglobus sp.]
MPLFDHFRPPVSLRHDWQSFHSRWAIAVMDSLNRKLPERFLAEAQIHLGRKVEADVVEFDRDEEPAGVARGPGNGQPGGGTTDGGGVAVAVEPAVYAPPAPAMSMPVEFHDTVEVKVYDFQRDRRVVAVVELVSPSNKDRPDERETFALKSLGYLKSGIGLVVADIVTDMHFNLHDELVRVGRSDDRFQMPGSPATYVVAYRPVRRKDENLLDVWPHELTVGAALPTVPLALKGFGCVRLDLAATYAEACERSRIP